jgi:hypothetical protein
MTENQSVDATDTLAKQLKGAAFTVLTVVFGLLPLFFIPLSAAPFGYSKILFVIVGLALILVLYSLYALRKGSISFKFPYALIALWAVFIITLVSALLSGDFKDAFIGDFFSIHSAAFVGILALSASIWALVDAEKAVVIRTYFLLAVSTVVLVVFHILRLIFGVHVLSFGIFTQNASSLIGGWNDLALFLGLSILLALVALEQLPLTKWGKWFFWAVAGLSLIMLSVINFIYVWVVLAIVSLVMLIYTIRKPQSSDSAHMLVGHEKKAPTSSSLVLSLVVFAVSVIFLVGGSAISGFINNHTNISFVEVRPSFGATTDIARQVYKNDAFLGTGPNRFADAWRMYKNGAINATVFWNTDFTAGSGYVQHSL